jgi:hypothetical protein
VSVEAFSTDPIARLVVRTSEASRLSLLLGAGARNLRRAAAEG